MRNVITHIVSFFGATLVLLTACQEPAPQVPYNKIEKLQTESALMEMNRQFAAIEDSLVTAYVDSVQKADQKTFTTTKTGLRYYIVWSGEGERAGENDDVTFRYTVRQLDGTECDKLKDVVKTANLEKGELTRGMREALRLLPVSGEGEFVMPSFLAYGVVGVPGCIPPWTPVSCQISLLEVKKH